MYETILRHPDAVVIDGREAEACGEGRWALGDAVLATATEGEALAVALTASQTPVSRVRLRWRFSARLRGQVLGDAWERAYGDLAWKNVTPYESLPWYALVNRGEDTVGYGVAVRPGAMCSWQVDPAGVTLRLDVRCGGAGVILGGRTLKAAKVVSRVYRGVSAFEAARDFCGRMCPDGILPPEPVYGSNNWYYAYGRGSAGETLAEAAYFSRLTRGIKNRPYVVIDDGWQAGRYRADGSYEDVYNGGPWLPNDRYGDMAELAANMAKLDVRPGIWVRLLLDDSPDIPADWRLPNGALDPSVPGVLQWVRADVDRIGSWGFRLLKHDFSTFDITGRWGSDMPYEVTGDGWRFADPSRTTAEIIVDLYRAILEAAAPHGMLVLGCNAVGHLGAGLMQLNRTGDDTSGLMWERTLRFGVNALAFRMPQHGIFFDADADCLGITHSIDWRFNRQWGELLAQSGTPLFVSVKPDSLAPKQEAALAQMLAASAAPRRPAEPLDWQETALPQTWLLDGARREFDWYEPAGLRVGCANGPVWEAVWREVSAGLGDS